MRNRDKLIILLLLAIIAYLSMEQWWASVQPAWDWLEENGVVVQSFAAILGILGTIWTVMKVFYPSSSEIDPPQPAQPPTPQYHASVKGNGVIAQGEKANVLGENATQVQGSVGGDVLGAGAKKNETTIINNNQPPTPEDVARARARYLNVLAQRCNVLPLAALGGQKGMAGKEVKLEKVYVALDTTSRVPLTEEEKEQDEYKYSSRDDRVLTALEVATQQPRLVLLGNPGSGKSTFVRQLVAGVARACESFDRLRNRRQAFDEGWQAGLLPLFVVLRDLAPRLERLTLNGSTEDNRKALFGAIWAQLREDLSSLGAEGFEQGLREALEDGSVLLVFDGLDEVPTASRERVRQAVNALIQSYSDIARIIVTCRIHSYKGNAKLRGFEERTLAPFSEAQIKNFIGLWYEAQAALEHIDTAIAQARTKDLQEAALKPSLRQLAKNPMLLTTMALIHQRQVGLPRERVRLYAQAVDLLMIRWQKHKKKPSAALEALLQDERRLRLIMERLAYEAYQTQSRSGAGDLPRGKLLTLLEDSAYLGKAGLASHFLDYVDQRAGLLIGRGGHEAAGKPALYAFPHRTFQEYLAGCYMVRGIIPKVTREYYQRLPEEDYWQQAALLGAEEIFYHQDAEKMIALSYRLCPAKSPQDQAAWRGVLWSGLMAKLATRERIERYAKDPYGDPEYLERLLNRLVELMEENHLPPIERAEAGRLLAKLGDPRREVLTVDEMEFCHVRAGAFWMGAPDDAQNASPNERPLHKITIPYDYWISRHPVTNAQFKEFMEAKGYKNRRYWTEAEAHGDWKDGKIQGRDRPDDYEELFNLPNHPVVGVTFYEALAFTRWFGERWGGAGLPTEVEWEKAARGGLMIPEKALIRTAKQLNDPAFLVSVSTLIANPLPQRHYPWGNQADPTRANYRDTGIGSTSAVGCFTKGESPYGCQEMSGNVDEWVQSLNNTYPYSPEYQREPFNLSSDREGIIIRSGSYYDNYINVRCFSRFRDPPNFRNDLRGFRVFRPYHL